MTRSATHPVIYEKIHPIPPAASQAATLTPWRTTPRRHARQTSKTRWSVERSGPARAKTTGWAGRTMLGPIQSARRLRVSRIPRRPASHLRQLRNGPHSSSRVTGRQFYWSGLSLKNSDEPTFDPRQRGAVHDGRWSPQVNGVSRLGKPPPWQRTWAPHIKRRTNKTWAAVREDDGAMRTVANPQICRRRLAHSRAPTPVRRSRA